MKLYEIITPMVEIIPRTGWNMADHPLTIRDDLGPTASGYYSHVSPGKNEWEIKKKSLFRASDIVDPFFKFATFLMDADLMNTNPFFPRIYNIKTEKDENGLRIYDATIEKLQPLSVMSERMQTVMRNMLVDINAVKTALPASAITGIGKIKSIDLITALYFIRNSIESSGISLLIRSPELKIAIQLLIDFLNKNPFYVIDLHRENFMVRQGGTGYQLILNDPISSDGVD